MHAWMHNVQAAEAVFKDVKHAYETIMKAQAGYPAPPPGTPPSYSAARTYWNSHYTDGRVPWGRYAGYESEWHFYRCGGMRCTGRVGTGRIPIPHVDSNVCYVM